MLNQTAKFRIGEIVRHRFSFRGVIYDVILTNTKMVGSDPENSAPT